MRGLKEGVKEGVDLWGGDESEGVYSVGGRPLVSWQYILVGSKREGPLSL